MCLTNISKKLIAKEDIIVYKVLDLVFNPAMDGVPFKGFIRNKFVKGKISIEYGKCYFCTNEPFLSGNNCNDKKGMSYSWVMDDQVNLHSIEPKLTVNDKFATYYRRTPIEMGKTYNSVLNMICERNENIIEEGLHSYVNMPTGRIVAKCIIPKGSTYYTGFFNNTSSIASDTLTYIKIIKNDTF